MQISNSTSFAAASATAARPQQEQRSDFKNLRQALRAGDLDAAKKAYGAIVRNAPDGATWKPGSPFAQVGKALATGDMAAAKSAYAAMVKSHAPLNGIKPVPAPTVPAGGSADSMVPGQISLIA